MSPEVFNEHYGPKADVYSFGMCLLEMVTNHTPYRECKNPGAVYKKVIEGIPPRDLELIGDLEVKAFIDLCLQPEE
jgi:WNK lysine deficient protein kinase